MLYFGSCGKLQHRQRYCKHGGIVFGHAPGSRAEYALKMIDCCIGLASLAL